jgi:Nuclear pore protein 84 / 107
MPSRAHSDSTNIHPRTDHSITLSAGQLPPQNPRVSTQFRVLNLLEFWPLSNRNLKYALDLANVIADSRYKIYEDFVNEHGRRLGEYLGAVRQAVLTGLEEGGSDPFRLIYSNF